jgi:hypothetical protein
MCLGGRCAAPDGDRDLDGLPNGYEVGRGLDPLNPDTDWDGDPDGDEVGADLDAPADSDGDGLIDALESAVEDADGDCVPDELDPRNDVPDASPAEVAAARCSRKGVCGAAFDAVVASCDGHGAWTCDASKVPGWHAVEADCDGLDDDCDGETDESFTLNGVPVGRPCDGGGACGQGVVECGADGATRCSTAPGGSRDASKPESCNGVDDDCDGETDEKGAEGCAMWFPDGDGDGFGAKAQGSCNCGEAPVGTASKLGDCDDADGDVHPGAIELCNDRDDDCDGETDEDAVVNDPPAGVCGPKGICAAHPELATLTCVDGKPACDWSAVPGYAVVEAACDGLDEDCDGRTDEDFAWESPFAGPAATGDPCGVGACAGGVVVCSADHAGATCSTAGQGSSETCNDIDDDCDGYVDDGLYKVFAGAAGLTTAGEPRPRTAAAMVFVPADAVPGGTGAALFTYGGGRTTTEKAEPVTAHADFWRYDLATHRFARIAAADPGARAGARLLFDPADAGGPRLLLVGGVVGGGNEDGPVWQYLLATSTWSPLPVSAPQTGTLGAAIDVAGRVMSVLRTDVFGGARLVRVHLDTLAVQESHLSLLPFRREAATAAAADGTVWVSGGYNAGGVPAVDLYAVKPSGAASRVTLAPDLPGRALHALAPLPDGSLLLVGGREPKGALAVDVLRVAPDAGTWSVDPAAPPPQLLDPTLCAAPDGAFLYSGMDKDGRGFRRVLRLDLAASQWTQDLLDVVAPARAYGAMAVAPSKGRAYLLGGVAEDLLSWAPVGEIWSMSLADGKFSRVQVMETFPPFFSGAVAVETRVEPASKPGAAAADLSVAVMHGGSGWESGKPSQQLVRFFVGSPSIDVVADAGGPGARAMHSLVWTGEPGRFLLHGGTDGTSTLGDVWSLLLDGSTVSWTKDPAPDRPRWGHAAVWDAPRKRMLVLGGEPDRSIAAFDPAAHEWTVLAGDPGIGATGASAFLDADASHVLLVPVSGGQALVATLRPDGGADVAPVALDAPPGLAGALAGFDPIGRSAMFFGGTLPDGGTSSAMWVVPTLCP